MTKQIFLDMDGVIVDFIGRCIDLFNLPIKEKEVTTYYHAMDRVFPDMRVRVNEYGEKFWSDISLYPNGQNLVNLCIKLAGNDNVFILTTPMKHKTSYSGKFESICKLFPQINKSNIFFGTKKWVVASPNKILVDDKTENVNDWISKGKGIGILYPRPWNDRNYKNDDVSFEFVKNKLLKELEK